MRGNEYNSTERMKDRCPMETAFGGPGPIRYCNQPVHEGDMWCLDHLVEWGHVPRGYDSTWKCCECGTPALFTHADGCSRVGDLVVLP